MILATCAESASMFPLEGAAGIHWNPGGSLSEIDHTLEGLRAEGTLDSSGRFLVDLAWALEKMRLFRWPKPHYLVLKLIQGLIGLGCTSLDVTYLSTLSPVLAIRAAHPDLKLLRREDFASGRRVQLPGAFDRRRVWWSTVGSGARACSEILFCCSGLATEHWGKRDQKFRALPGAGVGRFRARRKPELSGAPVDVRRAAYSPSVGGCRHWLLRGSGHQDSPRWRRAFVRSIAPVDHTGCRERSGYCGHDALESRRRPSIAGFSRLRLPSLALDHVCGRHRAVSSQGRGAARNRMALHSLTRDSSVDDRRQTASIRASSMSITTSRKESTLDGDRRSRESLTGQPFLKIGPGIEEAALQLGIHDGRLANICWPPAKSPQPSAAMFWAA